MKVKTSVTLSEELLDAIDELAEEHRSRSELLEEAMWAYVRRKAREARDARDIAIINAHADELNAEAEDVLDYQANVGDEIEA